MILGLLTMAAANAAVLLGARAILGRIRSGKPAVDLVLFLVLRFLLISLAVLAFGAASCLTPAALGIAGAAALAVLIARGAHRGWTLPRELPWGRIWTVVVVLAAVRLLVQVWMLAPYLDDTLAYHLPKVAEWTRAGAITRELGMDSRASFPAGFELLELWWVLFLHHDVLIEMAGVEFLLLATASVYALAAELGWSPRAGMTAALLFALGPGLYFQAVSCMNDGPVTALFLAATLLLVARQPLLIAAVPFALGAGIKPTIVYALPGLAILALWRRRDPIPSAPPTRPSALVAVGALLVGASWYVRNTVLFHNPIHPMGPAGMKSSISGATFQRLGPSLQALRENLACFLDTRVYDHCLAPDAMCTGNFNWGAAAFALGVPALIVVLRSEPQLRRIAVAYAASLLSVFTLVELDLYYARFVLFLAALPSLALARLWERHRPVAVLGAIALFLQALATMSPGNVPDGAAARMAATGWRERSAFPPPEDDVPGYCTADSGTAYSLYGPSYSRRVVYLRDATPDELLRHAGREGVTALYVSGLGSPQEVLIEEAAAKAGLKSFQRGPWKVFALRQAR